MCRGWVPQRLRNDISIKKENMPLIVQFTMQQRCRQLEKVKAAQQQKLVTCQRQRKRFYSRSPLSLRSFPVFPRFKEEELNMRCKIFRI